MPQTVEQLGENLRESKINVEECYNYTQLIAYRKANRRSATQEILRLLWNPIVRDYHSTLRKIPEERKYHLTRLFGAVVTGDGRLILLHFGTLT